MNHIKRRTVVLAALASAVLSLCASPAALAQAKPLQTQEHESGTIVAELMEATRAEGVLTLKVRYRNTGQKPAALSLITEGTDWDKYYLSSGNTKYLMLKDKSGNRIASAPAHYGDLKRNLEPNASFTFWAKYPAPPADVKKITFYTPHTAPFENVPVSDAK
jgi:hypothetical protein